GNPVLIHEFNKARMPYNINILTQITAKFALQHQDIFASQAIDIRNEREHLWQQLTNLPGILAYPSQANFILFQVNNPMQVLQNLKQQGILIKCLHGTHPLLVNCLRVTVGTSEENAAFLAALTKITDT
ncbi:histidinol-phosphate aminotransferase, partial [Achromatium sp. WMS1]